MSSIHIFLKVVEERMKKVWVVTGISGSGRRELLDELAEKSGGYVAVYDVGSTMLELADLHGLNIRDNKILDIDDSALVLLRANAVQSILKEIERNEESSISLIGVHSVFPWRGRLIPGISIKDIISFHPDGIINIVEDVSQVTSINKLNPKWRNLNELDTQYWMMEEEYISKLYAETIGKDFFVIPRKHDLNNLLELLKNNKKKRIYLSYPITAIKKDDPEFFQKLDEEIRPKLYELFIVFNPLDIKDVANISTDDSSDPQMNSANLMKKERTVERDYAFIDQSDAIVVFYKTDKHSPGVAAEIEYAHRNSKDVFMFYPYRKSPFLERAVDEIFDDESVFWNKLESFSRCE